MKIRKNTKLLLMILLATAMVLSACSSNGGKSATNTPTNKPTNEAKDATQTPDETASNEHLELSLALWNVEDAFKDPNAQNDTIYTNEIAEKFNVTLKPVQITWNDWAEKAKVWAASNQLPDMFAQSLATDSPALYKSWAEQGVIKPIPDDLSEYPNLQKIFSLPAVQALKIDGKFYMIPRMNSTSEKESIDMARPIRYRADWAAEAGYTSQPETFEEFLEMTQAVMKLHPGISGVSINNTDYLMTLFLGSYPEMTDLRNWTKENDQWVPAFTSEKAYTGVQQLRELYSSGVLDRDFAIQKDGDGVNKFMAGQSFALFGPASIEKTAIVSQFVEANPGVDPAEAIDYVTIWPAADGKRYTFNGPSYWSELYFPNSLSDEKFKRALQLADYMLSLEWQVLFTNGIEGVDYKVESDGKYVNLLGDGESIATKYPITANIAYMVTWGGDPFNEGKVVLDADPQVAGLQQGLSDTRREWETTHTPMPIDFNVYLLSTPEKNKISSLTTDIKDALVKLIIDKGDPVEEWKNVLSKHNNQIQAAIDEVNAEVAK
jgi:putative aldouronate transport system substrate-binding protein